MTLHPILALDHVIDSQQVIGLDALTKKHDPYCDIPLNKKLPQPVMELPGPNTEPLVPEQGELFGKGSGVRSRESGPGRRVRKGGR